MSFFDDFFGGKMPKIKPPKPPKPPKAPNMFSFSSSSFTINGMSIDVQNGKLFVDGVEYVPASGDTKPRKENVLEDLADGNKQANISSDIVIEALEGNLTVYARGGQPTVKVLGDVGGSVDAAGSVNVGGVAKAVDAGGSITVQGDVGGNADAGGSITCRNIGGDADAGGSITATNIHGDADAGGSIHMNRR